MSVHLIQVPLNGVDADKLSASAKAMGLCDEANAYRNAIQQVSWTVAAQQGLSGLRRSFNAAAMKQSISFGTKSSKLVVSMKKIQLRLGKEHAAILKSKAEMLNKEQFSALHYTAPGTDLTLAKH